MTSHQISVGSKWITIVNSNGLELFSKGGLFSPQYSEKDGYPSASKNTVGGVDAGYPRHHLSRIVVPPSIAVAPLAVVHQNTANSPFELTNATTDSIQGNSSAVISFKAHYDEESSYCFVMILGYASAFDYSDKNSHKKNVKDKSPNSSFHSSSTGSPSISSQHQAAFATQSSLYRSHISNAILCLLHGVIQLFYGEIGWDQCNQHVEVFKRQLRSMTSYIDTLLLCDESMAPSSKMQLAIQLPQCFMMMGTISSPIHQGLDKTSSSSPNHFNLRNIAQKKIEKSCEVWGTSNIAIFVDGAYFVFSDGWSGLSVEEQIMIQSYVKSQPPSSARDVPIKLRGQGVRLVTVQLDQYVELCMLCGKEPSIHDVIISIMDDYLEWEWVKHLVRYVRDPAMGRAILQFDSNLLGILMVDRQKLFFAYETVSGDTASRTFIQNLIEFYICTATKTFKTHQFLQISNIHKNFPMKSNENANTSGGKQETIVKEAYMRMKKYCLCGIRKGKTEFYCVYNQNVPTYALIGLTHEALDLVISKFPK